MSPMYLKIKKWHESGTWSEQWVRNAQAKGKITLAEMREILGIEDEEQPDGDQ